MAQPGFLLPGTLSCCPTLRNSLRSPVIPVRRNPSSAAFTLLQLLVVIAIIVVLGVLAGPTIRQAITKRDMTRTMNNARGLYLAGFHMATDGAAKADTSSAWPGDYPASDLADYCTKLVQKGYVKTTDLQEMLSAPGANCTVQSTGEPQAVTLSGTCALKVYKVKSTDPSNTIFAASSNYIYDTLLNPAAVPFGDAGFVVIRKSGDAGLYKSIQATPAGYDNNPARFQSELGALPGANEGSVAPGDGTTVLTGLRER
jgi:type II secretory pathway pseudopilin PulG